MAGERYGERPSFSKALIELRTIINHLEAVEKGLRKKGWTGNLNELLELEEKRKEIIQKVEPLRAEQKREGKKMASADGVEKKALQIKLSQLSQEVKKLQAELAQVQQKLKQELLSLPNPALAEVPEGTSEAENVVLKEWGTRPSFSFAPRHHLEIGEKLGILDVTRAAKVSGSRFAYLLGDGVRMQFGLIQYCMDLLQEAGFLPILPPVLAREEIIQGMGYLPEADEDMFLIEKDALRLAATSEQTIGPFYKDEILDAEQLPKRFMGYSTCFRREAGSYGRDVKGIMRVHQFDKVEMFIFCLPEDSKKFHQHLLTLEEKIVQGLQLPYRVVEICGGELGFPASRKFDVECWIPSEGRYRETHSCSNCLDFQARRLNIRFRRGQGQKLEVLHTLNGTASACGRMLLAILENNQQEDGSVRIPEVLSPYLGGRHFLRAPD